MSRRIDEIRAERSNELPEPVEIPEPEVVVIRRGRPPDVQVLEPLYGIRQKGESLKAVSACNDYLRMGPGRGQLRLLKLYEKLAEQPHTSMVPTLSLNAIRTWNLKFGWKTRAELFDMNVEKEKDQRADEALGTGLALYQERVIKLKHLADHLETFIWEDRRLWNRGRFQDSLIQQYRGILDDLAMETGGRVSKTEIGGFGGSPLELGVIHVLRGTLERRFEDILDGQWVEIQAESDSGSGGGNGSGPENNGTQLALAEGTPGT